MPITYPEGGMPGLLLKQRQRRTAAIDTFKVQLVPLRAAPRAKIGGPEDVVMLVREMEDYDREYAKIIHLDTKNQVMGVETISIGSLSMNIVHPRETVKGAILNNSANVIFVHNHPSGICEPSREDIEISKKLKEAFQLVGIELLDSVIVGKGCHFSLREAGYITGKAETPVETASRFRVSEPIRKLPVRGMFPEICPTCRYECLTCPYRVNPEKKFYKFVGTRKIPKLVNSIEVFLNRLTVDTGVPIPESAVTGAAIPEGGFLFAYHVTDYPEEVMRKLRATAHLCELNPAGDIGCGLYVSGVPQYWFVRSREKWEFARHLNRAQRQALVTAILSDPKYRKGGGYLADFEVDYLNRDLKRFAETGDVNLLAMTGNQPYNVRITEEIARKAGVPIPKMPKMVKVKLRGRFINAAGLYSNPEILNRAQAWAVINRPKLLEWNRRASAQDIVNAWLCSLGYSGAFTKSGMSTNPEMVIWDRKAIIGAWIPEPQT